MAAPPGDKIQSMALLLPLFGLVLLMPPVLLAFGVPVAVAGVPLIVVYIFVVWALLIIGAAWLARRLATPPDLPPAKSKAMPQADDRLL